MNIVSCHLVSSEWVGNDMLCHKLTHHDYLFTDSNHVWPESFGTASKTSAKGNVLRPALDTGLHERDLMRLRVQKVRSKGQSSSPARVVRMYSRACVYSPHTCRNVHALLFKPNSNFGCAILHDPTDLKPYPYPRRSSNSPISFRAPATWRRCTKPEAASSRLDRRC